MRYGVRTVTAIGATVMLNPEEGKRQILRALERSRGRMCSAAIELGTRRRNLEGLVRQLDLWPAVEACRARWRARRKDPLNLQGTQHVS